MPKSSFALDARPDTWVEVEWKPRWRNVTVLFENRAVKRIEDRRSLSKGCLIALPNGERVEVKLARSFGAPVLRVLRDGAPLPLRAPRGQLLALRAAHALYSLSAMYAVGAFAAFVARVDVRATVGLDATSAILVSSMFFGLGETAGDKSRATLGFATVASCVCAALSLMAAERSRHFLSMLACVIVVAGAVASARALGAAARRQA
jgi:hypothetical protein